MGSLSNKQLISMSLWFFAFCHSLRSSAVLCVSAVKLSFFLTTRVSAVSPEFQPFSKQAIKRGVARWRRAGKDVLMWIEAGKLRGRILSLLCFTAAIGAISVNASGQTVSMPPRDSGPAVAHKKSSPSGTRAPNVAELAARVEELSSQVAELTRLLASLTAPGAQAAKPAAATTQPEGPVSALAEAPAALARNAPTPDVNPSSRAAATISGARAEPVSAAETPAKAAIGPLRFGGDFRLRLDAILRPAFNSAIPGQPSLQAVQNIRGRYRLRLNLDADILPSLSFHGQLSTGPANNPLTLDQDFSATVSRHPFMINEAWVDFHPSKGIVLQGGKVQEVFADNLRFLFDDDVTFNGFNQRAAHDFKTPFAGIRRIEWRSGQYVFSNPAIAVVTPGDLGPTGAMIGSTGRAAQLFHQGVLLTQGLSPRVSQQIGLDLQVYRNPNQIQFASTPAGVPVIVQNSLGIALSSPVKGTGNATTTPGGAMYAARGFQVARATWRLDYSGLKSARQEYPLTLNLQVARNTGTGQPERDALLANFKIGRIQRLWDHSILYMFAVKGANSMISQLTDDDLGTSTGVNIRSHFFRFDLGLGKGIQVQSLFFIQNQLRNSGQYPGFFVPLGAYAPRQYRFQEQIVFSF